MTILNAKETTAAAYRLHMSSRDPLALRSVHGLATQPASRLYHVLLKGIEERNACEPIGLYAGTPKIKSIQNMIGEKLLEYWSHVDGEDDSDKFERDVLGLHMRMRDDVRRLSYDFEANRPRLKGECQICYENITDERYEIKQACGNLHVFHKHCLDGSRLIKETCPECRAEMIPGDFIKDTLLFASIAINLLLKDMLLVGTNRFTTKSKRADLVFQHPDIVPILIKKMRRRAFHIPLLDKSDIALDVVAATGMIHLTTLTHSLTVSLLSGQHDTETHIDLHSKLRDLFEDGWRGGVVRFTSNLLESFKRHSVRTEPLIDNMEAVISILSHMI